MSDRDIEDFKDNHAVIIGGTRKGKSKAMQLFFRSSIIRGTEGATLIDKHGEVAREELAWLANPRNGATNRKIYVLDPASPYCIGINPLQVPKNPSWDECHDAAQMLTSVVEARFGKSAEETPRMSKIIYCAAMACARKNLSLIELTEMLSVGKDYLRDSILHDFNNPIVRSELDDLFMLAERQPVRFREYVDSTKNRFTRLLSHPRLARILGQPHGMSPRRVMDERGVVIVDLSSVPDQDASFISTLLTSTYYVDAKRRPPKRCAYHRLIIDEGESALTADFARTLDQTAKFGLLAYIVIQRLEQARAKGDYVVDAILTNCAIKICFGGLQAASARYMAEMFFTGFVDFNEWVAGTERPIAVGQTLTLTHSRSRGEQQSSQQSIGVTDSHSTARARSTTTSHTDSTGRSTAIAQAETLSHAEGEASSTGTSASASWTPRAKLFGPNHGNATDTPLLSSQDIGESASRSSSEMSVRSIGTSESISDIATSSESLALSESTTETEGHAITRTNGMSQGATLTAGQSEVFVTKYELMPTKLLSLEEQMHRHTGHLMNLPRRMCFVKVDGGRPFLTRTKDVEPAFRSIEFQNLMVPLLSQNIVRYNPHMRLATEVDREIEDRLRTLSQATLPKDETAFDSPEPFVMPPSRELPPLGPKLPGRKPKPKASPKTRPTKSPHLSVIDGGDKPEDDGQEPAQ